MLCSFDFLTRNYVSALRSRQPQPLWLHREDHCRVHMVCSFSNFHPPTSFFSTLFPDFLSGLLSMRLQVPPFCSYHCLTFFFFLICFLALFLFAVCFLWKILGNGLKLSDYHLWGFGGGFPSSLVHWVRFLFFLIELYPFFDDSVNFCICSSVLAVFLLLLLLF